MPDEAPARDDLRPLLFSIAYRMLGSVADAEDVVQEAFLRLARSKVDGAEIQSERAFLTTVTTRLAIDQLRSARRQRETYFGPWLPEPLLTSPDADPAALADMSDSLSLSFLVLLETLSPVERAVFLLRQVFDYGYDEIAEIVQRSEANCRQLFVRAQRRLDEGKPRFKVDREQREALASRFIEAAIEPGPRRRRGLIRGHARRSRHLRAGIGQREHGPRLRPASGSSELGCALRLVAGSQWSA